MRSTKPIRAGEQIFNTYGNPPNSDLLRRYGHVDEPNGNDVVELKVDNLLNGWVDLLNHRSRAQADADEDSSNMSLDSNVEELKEDVKKRLEWAFEFSLLDDTFILTYPFPPSDQEPYLTGTETSGKLSNKDYRRACRIDSDSEDEPADHHGRLSGELLQAARLILMSGKKFEKVKKKLSLPKPEVDSIETSDSGLLGASSRDISIAELITCTIRDRMKAYPTSLEADEVLLYGASSRDAGTAKDQAINGQRLQINNASDERLRKSLVVRVGEKRILRDNGLLFEFVKREVDKEIEKKQKKESKKRNSSTKDKEEINGKKSKRRKG